LIFDAVERSPSNARTMRRRVPAPLDDLGHALQSDNSGQTVIQREP
jgi:hypothetical protein